MLIYALLTFYIISRAKTQGVEFLVGFETEFIMLKSTTPIATVHNAQAYSNSIALPTGSIAEVVLEEIAESLLSSGIVLQMYHPGISYYVIMLNVSYKRNRSGTWTGMTFARCRVNIG